MAGGATGWKNNGTIPSPELFSVAGQRVALEVAFGSTISFVSFNNRKEVVRCLIVTRRTRLIS